MKIFSYSKEDRQRGKSDKKIDGKHIKQLLKWDVSMPKYQKRHEM